MNIKFPNLYDLTPDEVQCVIDDLEAELGKARVLYALDSYELVDFCFPVNPSDPRNVDIDKIAQDQAALYELLYVRPDKPVLLPEYVKEMQGLLNYFGNEGDRVYSKAEVLNQLIRLGGLERITSDAEQGLEKAVEEDFNVILVVAMGLYSIGATRFGDLFKKRRLVQTIIPDEQSDHRVIRDIANKYERSKLADTIVNLFEQFQDERPTDRLLAERIRRNNLVDANAIDRIIYLNTEFHKAYEAKDLSRPYILLYFSGAPKTRRLFQTEELSEAIYRIQSKPWNLYRTRQQIFAYVVHKAPLPETESKEGSKVDIKETIKNLTEVKKILLEVAKINSTGGYWRPVCNHCPIEISKPHYTNRGDCQHEAFCSRVVEEKERIQRKKQQIQNLGLVNTVTDYAPLLEAGYSKNYKQYYKLFKRIFKSHIKDIAMAQMKQRQEWILARTQATNLFKEGIDLGLSKPSVHILRASKDKITGVDQYLPTKPKLLSERYAEIAASILDYYKDPSQLNVLEEAYLTFMEVAPPLGSIDWEAELVRCYLYLAFGRSEEENKPYNLAARSLERAVSYGDEEVAREFLYVLCWAARRVGKFAEAVNVATRGIEKWPEDPRFYHGRCLAIYSWLIDDDQRTACPYGVDDAIQDAQSAIDRYKAGDGQNQDVIAANYNNLAFFYAMKVTLGILDIDESWKCLESARDALLTLRKCIDKDQWKPQHPEFYHTEAFLEFQEFTVGFSGGKSKAYLNQKLSQAKQEIDKAIALYPNGPSYQELLEKIEKAQKVLR
jgi:hypothetical protein